jgi:hypothetical protein
MYHAYKATICFLVLLLFWRDTVGDRGGGGGGGGVTGFFVGNL